MDTSKDKHAGRTWISTVHAWTPYGRSAVHTAKHARSGMPKINFAQRLKQVRGMRFGTSHILKTSDGRHSWMFSEDVSRYEFGEILTLILIRLTLLTV